MDLLQHLVDVDGIRFLTLGLALLSVLSNGLGGLAGFLGSFSRGLGRHVDSWVGTVKLNVCWYFAFAFILKRSLTLGLRKSPRPPHYGNLCSNGYAGKNSKENGGYLLTTMLLILAAICNRPTKHKGSSFIFY